MLKRDRKKERKKAKDFSFLIFIGRFPDIVAVNGLNNNNKNNKNTANATGTSKTVAPVVEDDTRSPGPMKTLGTN